MVSCVGCCTTSEILKEAEPLPVRISVPSPSLAKTEEVEKLTVEEAFKILRDYTPLTGYSPDSGQVCGYTAALNKIESERNALIDECENSRHYFSNGWI